MDCVSAIENTYSDEMLKAVGLLFITAAIGENALLLQSARLAQHPQSMRSNPISAMTGMEVKVRLEKIALLVHLIAPEHGTEARQRCGKIRKSYERRNEIAHNMDTGFAPDRLHLSILKFRSDGQMAGDKVYTAKQIRGFAITLFTRITQLDDLLNGIGITPTPEWIE